MQTSDYQQLELFRSLLETSTEAIFICDGSGKVVYLNEKAKAFPELDIQQFLQQSLQEHPTKNFEISFSPKDRPQMFFSVNSRCLYGSQNQKIGAMVRFQDITSSKVEKEWLHVRFKAIFEQSPFSIQILSKEGRTLLVNPAYKELWGIDDELVENYVYKSYNILEDKLLEKEGHLENILRGYAGETVQIPPFYYNPPSLGLPGRGRWTGGLIYPLKDLNGNVQELVIIHRDVTDQYEANAEKENLLNQLMEEKNRLATIIDRIPAGIMVVEAPDAEVTLRNERMKKMERKPFQNMSSYVDYKITFPDGRLYTLVDYPVYRSLKTGEVVNDEELRIQYINGEQLIFCVSSTPIYDQAGKITACAVVTNDITEKKRTDAIQNFLDRVKSVLLSTLDVNKTIEDLAYECVPFLADGCYVDLIEGNEVKRIITHHQNKELKEKIEEMGRKFPQKKGTSRYSYKAMEAGEPLFIKKITDEHLRANSFNEEHYQLGKDTELNSYISVPLQIRGKIIGTICFTTNGDYRFLDETDFETCKEVAKHAALAIDNSKLYRNAQSAIELRDDFISMASHELKTPITSLNLQIKVVSSIIKEFKTNEARYAVKVMGDTGRQIERLGRLVDDMLDVSRLATGRLSLIRQEIDLTKIAQDVLNRFHDQLISLGIEHSFKATGPVLLQGDPYRLDQVVTNFITNAIRYGERNPIEIMVESQNGKAILKVKDHGRGIEVADQERIFNRFERSQHSMGSVPGLGLGLFINKQIVLEHGGTIRVESEPGDGATFIVEI